MALLKCRDCKSKISDAASACPKCGRPVTDLDRRAAEAGRKVGTTVTAVVVIIAAGVFLVDSASNSASHGGDVPAAADSVAAHSSAPPSYTPPPSSPAAPDTEVFSKLHLTTSWHGEAGNTVMLATFTIRNRSDQAVSNFAVICTLYAPSGTVLDVKTPTLYVTVRAHKSKTVHDVNLGFINQQTHSASCTLADYDAP